MFSQLSRYQKAILWIKTNLVFEYELYKNGVIESVEYSVHNHSVSNEDFIFEFKTFINMGT